MGGREWKSVWCVTSMHKHAGMWERLDESEWLLFKAFPALFIQEVTLSRPYPCLSSTWAVASCRQWYQTEGFHFLHMSVAPPS